MVDCCRQLLTFGLLDFVEFRYFGGLAWGLLVFGCLGFWLWELWFCDFLRVGII